MLSSECPGWVCYLEKVLGQKFIKFASRVKPPQMVAASILRTLFSNIQPPVEPSKIFIGLIAPCFDKKLEAAREEVRQEHPVIDLVLASNEINDFMSKYIPDFQLYVNNQIKGKKFFVDPRKVILNEDLNNFGNLLPQMSNFVSDIDDFRLFKGYESHGNSNGYLSYIISLMDDVESVTYKNIKNQNFKEVNVQTKNGESIQFAYVYGFKNIQNLVRRIKRKKCKYRYVEIMACPMGCANGGGQLPLKVNEVSALVEETEKIKKFYDFEKEIEKLEKLVAKEEKGSLSAEGLGFYHIEPIEEKDPLKIKW